MPDQITPETTPGFARGGTGLRHENTQQRGHASTSIVPDALRWSLPEPLAAAVLASLESWRQAGKAARLWAHDASLWTGGNEAEWLGWLDITAQLCLINHIKCRAVFDRAGRIITF